MEIIGTQKFEEFVRNLEVEGVGVGITKDPPPLGVHVYPLKIKADFNIEIPILTPGYTRDFKGLDDAVVKALPANPKGLTMAATSGMKVTLVETVTQKTVAQKQVTIDTGLPEINEILIHLTNRICKEARIEGQFAVVYPIVRKYVREVFFGQEVDMDTEQVRRLLSQAANRDYIISTLAKAIGDKTIYKITSTLKSEPLSLLELDGFYWRRDWCELEKTVFNVTPCFNPFEKHFAQFLEHAGDIQRFAKLAESYTKFSIEYLNHKGALSVYYPDFVAAQERKDKKTVMWLIETKGWEQADVPLKDARAVEWCADATRLTGTTWQYLKVKFADYMTLTSNLSKWPAPFFNEFLDKMTNEAKKSQGVLVD